MLHQPIDELLFDAEGKVIGVRAGKQVATAPHVIGDPSYFPKEKLSPGKKVGSEAIFRFLHMSILQQIVPNNVMCSFSTCRLCTAFVS